MFKLFGIDGSAPVATIIFFAVIVLLLVLFSIAIVFASLKLALPSIISILYLLILFD